METNHKISERFETTLSDIDFLEGLEILIGNVRCDVNKQLQDIKAGDLNNPNAKLKIGNYNEGFKVYTWLSDKLINLRGEYWDKLRYPSNPVLYTPFYNFINGVRKFRKTYC